MSIAPRLATAVLLVFAFSLTQAADEPACVISFDSASLNVCSGESWLASDRLAPLAKPATVAGSPIRVVKFERPLSRAQRTALEGLGAEVLGYLPHFAYKVRMDSSRDAAALQIDGVTWVGPFLPAWKVGINLARDLASEGMRAELDQLELSVHAGADLETVLTLLASIDGVDVAFSTPAGGGYVRLNHDLDQLDQIVDDIVTIDEVAWVSFFFPHEFHNSQGTWLHQSGENDPLALPLFERGLYGCGQLIGVLDSGLTTTHCSFEDPDPGNDFPFSNCTAGINCAAIGATDTHRKIGAFYNWHSATSVPGDGGTGHGTFVVGNALGNDFAEPVDCAAPGSAGGLTDRDGMAPGARVIMQEAAPNLEYLNQLGGDLQHAAEVAHQDGAAIHNNSWGSGCRNAFGLCVAGCVVDYRPNSRFGDIAAWENPELLIVSSAGNSGGGDGGPGCGLGADIGSPANAKNVFAIGANQRGVLGDNMAAFSSRGPTFDRRTKPDIVAQGEALVSPSISACGTRSTSGTSFSSPTAAGFAALVREYLQRGFYPLGIEDDNFAISNPSAALIRAIMTNSSVRITGNGAGSDFPNQNIGWGRLRADDALYFEGDDRRLWLHDERDGLETAEVHSHTLTVESGQALAVTLIWHDFPAEAGANPVIVNQLRLELETPSGDVWTQKLTPGGGLGNPNPFQGTSADDFDDRNSVHQILLEAPESGIYELRVRGVQVAMGGQQPYALVATGALLGIGEPEFVLQIDPPTVAVCQGLDAEIEIAVLSVLDFDDPVDLSIDGVPTGATADFSPGTVVPATPAATSDLSIGNTMAVDPGSYLLEITGDSSGPNFDPIIKTRNLDLRIDAPIAAPTLSEPEDGAVNVDLRPLFGWSAVDGAVSYQFQLATDADFSAPVIDLNLSDTAFAPSEDLATGQNYFWRVRAINACGDSDWSSVFGFQTRFEPVAQTSPDAFEFEVQIDLGLTDSGVLEIGNIGNGVLDWEIRTDQGDSVCGEQTADVPWLLLGQETGGTPGGDVDQISITADATDLEHGFYEAVLCVSSNTTVEPSEIVIPVTFNVIDPEIAFLQGTVTSLGLCQTPGGPVEGAELVIETATSQIIETTTDENGFYTLLINENESPLTITVSAPQHAQAVRDNVALTGMQTTVEDFDLEGDVACIEVGPTALDVVLDFDDITNEVLTISNVGSLPLSWSIINQADPEAAVSLPRTSAPLIGFNFTTAAAGAADPQNWTRISTADGSLSNVQDDTGAPTSVGISWGGVSPSLGFVYLGTSTLAADAVPQFAYDLSGMTGYGFRSDGVFFIELDGLRPNADYEFWFVGYRGGSAIDNRVTVSDGADPAGLEFSQAITAAANNSRFLVNEVNADNSMDWDDLALVTRSDSDGRIRFEWQGISQTTVIGALAIRETAGCDLPDWLSFDPASGSIDAGDPANQVTVTLDATGLTRGEYNSALCVASNDPTEPQLTIPVNLEVVDPDLGFLEGTVTSAGICGEPPEALVGASVIATGGSEVSPVVFETSTDESGFYTLEINQNDGPVNVAVAADGHFEALRENVVIEGKVTTVEDFELTADVACIDVQPEALEASLPINQGATADLSIGNFGTRDLDWQIGTGDAGAAILPRTSSDPLIGFNFTTAASATPDPQNWNRISAVEGTLENVPDDTGAASGVNFSWGGVGSLGPLFLATATLAPDAVPQYDYDLSGMTGYGFRSGGRFFIELTGLQPSTPYEFWLVAYRVAGNIDNIVEVSDGDELAAFSFKQTITGADNDGRFVINDLPSSSDQNWNELSFETRSGSDGSLRIEWEGDTDTTVVVGAFAIRRAVDCSLPSWLSVAPIEGTVQPDASPDTVTASFDPAQLAPGTYEASLCLFSNDPLRPLVEVPVTLNTELPEGWGGVTGQVSSLGYCNADPSPVEGAVLTITGQTETLVLETDADGSYAAFLPASESPLTITATFPNHQDRTVSADLTVGSISTRDIELLLDEPCAEVQPEQINVSLDPGQSTFGVIELSNQRGNASLLWQIDTAQPAELARTAIVPAIRSGAFAADQAELEFAPGQAPGELPTLAFVAGDGAVDCESVPGLLALDDGTIENGYSGNPDVVSEVRFTNRFTPESYPSRLNHVCVAFRGPGGPQLDFDVVVYAADGPDGAPGTFLGAVPFSADNVPPSSQTTPVWQAVDVSSLDIVVASGSVYIGAAWAPSSPNVFLTADQSTDRPVGFGGGFWWNDSAQQWAPIQEAFPDYRAVLVRAIQGQISCDNPESVPWLSAEPSFGFVNPGQAREIQVNLNASGLSPGLYEAGLCVFSNDPVRPVFVVPVNLTVRVPASFATIEGEVRSLGYCDQEPAPAAGAEVTVVGPTQSFTTNANQNGFYSLSLPADEGPVDVIATAPDHLTGTIEAVAIGTGQTTTVDLDLTIELGCSSIVEDGFAATVLPGESDTRVMSLQNLGAAGSSFEVDSIEITLAGAPLERPRAGRGADDQGIDADTRAGFLDEVAAEPDRRVEFRARGGASVSVLVVSPDGYFGNPIPPNNLVDDLNAFPGIEASLYDPPSLGSINAGDLIGFDVVVTTNNNRWTDAGAFEAAGDALADYVDAGGRVILHNFALDDVFAGAQTFRLGGRYIDDGYAPMTLAPTDVQATVTMNIVLPDHPIFSGVGSVGYGTNFRNSGHSLTAGAELLANWSDGVPMMAINEHSLYINAMYSSDGAQGVWTGDLDLVVANAVLFLADDPAPAPWLSFEPVTGVIEAGDQAEVEITFTGLPELELGDYSADILVRFDEGDGVERTRSVPASLSIVAERTDARVQLAHLAPFPGGEDTAVDIDLSGERVASGFRYGDSTGYLDVAPGVYTVEIFPAGNAQPVLTVPNVALNDGVAYSVIAIGDGNNQALALKLLVDDFDLPPESDHFQLRLGHLAPFADGTASAEVRLADGSLIQAVDFGDVTAFIELEAGTYDLQITAPGGSPVLIDPVPVSFEAGDVVSAFASGDGVNQALGVFAWPPDTEGFFVPLVGDPQPGPLVVSPAVVDFGQVTVTSSASRLITVSHGGAPDDDPLAISEINRSGDDVFEISGGDCEAMVTVLDPGDSCEIEVSFSPQSAEVFAGEISVVADGESVSATLAGEGIVEGGPDDQIFNDRFEDSED